MSAYVHATSTRKVDDLVRALGRDTGVSKSTVSRIRSEIDEQVAAFRGRRLDHTTFPYVFCDATYVKARVAQAERPSGEVVSLRLRGKPQNDLSRRVHLSLMSFDASRT